jgi:cytoskeletal protein CcmA (bactofilin family)
VSALTSVNGTVKVGTNAQVAGDATSVNGAMWLGRGSSVEGNVESVNGQLTLDATRVDGQLKTVNGDINVGARSYVRGGILVEKRAGSSLSNQNNHKPRITIGPEAVVEGTLEFEREVDLYISDTAKIGKIEGATPIRFSGEWQAPPGEARRRHPVGREPAADR